MMLKLESGPFRSKKYHLSVDGEEVGELTYSLSGRKVQVTVEGRSLAIEDEGLWNPQTFLREGEQVLATAQKRHVLSSRVQIHYAGETYEILPKRWQYGVFLIENEGQEFGRILRSKGKRFGAELDLPDELPLELQILVGWIALSYWASSESAAAAAAGA